MPKLVEVQFAVQTSGPGPVLAIDGTVEISEQCANCRRFVPITEPGKYICLAFPEGIPKGIISGEIDHSKPVAGDKGLVFDSLSKRAAV